MTLCKGGGENDKRERKAMDLKEFREAGFLQEANRLFFHPLGLALGVNVDESGAYTDLGIWDCRDDPEGIVFDEVEQPKVDHVQALRDSKMEARLAAFGYHVQGSPEKP